MKQGGLCAKEKKNLARVRKGRIAGFLKTYFSIDAAKIE